MCCKTSNMAARHVDVNERRLRPVYDALDLMNNKQAIQLADKILKKQKDLHCAKVLKSLALLRSGRQAECAALMDEVMNAKPCDDSTLQAMTICFREMQKPEGVAKMYDTAVKQCPKNEEFHSHLFMAYVRISDYKKQQQFSHSPNCTMCTSYRIELQKCLGCLWIKPQEDQPKFAAMNLYKAFPKNPYYFWSVMSIVMQSIHCNNERLSKTMLLPLAERMIEKFVNEKKIEAEAEVHLYLMILEYLEKYDKALEVLKGPLGEKIVSIPLECEEKQASYLMKLGKWADANIAYKKLIEKVPDQWSYYQSYFSSLTALINENWKPSEDLENGKVPDHDVEQLCQFLSTLKEEEISKGKQACRGPFLAQLEVEKLITEEKLKDTRQDPKAVSELLVEYFERFGDKNCLFHDLSPYLYLLNKDQQEQFVEVLKKNLQGVSDDEPKSNHIKHLYRKLNIEQLSRFVGIHERLTVDEKITLSKEYMKLHKNGLELGKDLEPTVPQHSDGFALLSAHLLLDVNQEKGTNEMVWHIFILLESALRASPSNHHIKILLTRIYSLMGGCGPSMSLFEGMEIKHIQLDTLGYLASRYLYYQGHFEAALSLYTTTLKYFFGNQKDTPEYFTAAYKFGSFEKIPEFESFRTRLNFSVHFSTVTYEKLMMETLQRTKSLADAQSYFEESKMVEKCSVTKEWTNDLRDNRDLHIFATCDPPDKAFTKEQETHSFEQEVLWIRLRCLILRGLGQAVTLVAKPTLNDVKSEKPAPSSTPPLEETITALEQLLTDIDKHPGLQEKLPLLGPPPSHLHTTRKGKHGNIVLESLKMCQLSHLLHQGSSESQEDHCKKITAIIHFITETIQDDLKLCISSLMVENGEKQMMFNGQALEPLVHLVETFSHLVLLTSVSCSLLHKVITTKKVKKKAPASHVVGLREACKNYIDMVKSSTAELHSALENIQLTELSQDLLEMSLTEMDKETNSSVATEIWRKLQTSYTESIKQIRELLNTKMTFAKTLHL